MMNSGQAPLSRLLLRWTPSHLLKAKPISHAVPRLQGRKLRPRHCAQAAQLLSRGARIRSRSQHPWAEVSSYSEWRWTVPVTRFPGGPSGEEPDYQCRRCKRRAFDPWVGKIPWRRAWHPAPLFLPGESHGQRSLAGHSPWGWKELDKSEVTQHAHARQFWTVATPSELPHPLPRCPSACLAVSNAPPRGPRARRGPHSWRIALLPGLRWATLPPPLGPGGLVCMDLGVSCIPPPLLLPVVGSAQTGCSDHGVDYLAGGRAWEGESVA